ncbi:succinyl-diaminopimelate desuccinylase [Brevibacterium album]|uniref:succinyl-diaminopimelate desuccinylase n=1 Tax=Brevibacterium album TaxID=417948 RepID=UPI000405C7CD|nr:succinyl-diaminopimelate desuccinylase [Brevibacterium album]
MSTDFSASTDADLLEAALADPAELTARLCDIPSVSGDEARIADAVEELLRRIGAGAGPDLEIVRDGDAVIARTRLGRAERVLIAGHLDTVPIEDNVPSVRRELEGTEVIWGRGACDMKAGVAMQLVTAARLREPVRDVTWVFYDHEEVDASLNGLGRVAAHRPDLLAAELAILGEPSDAGIQGGCNGTMRVDVRTRGVRAHSARAFMGVNAIHAAAPVLAALAEYEAETVAVDGLDYRESLSAVGIRGGVAGNVVPDECVVSVNYRFAPAKSGAEAEAFLRALFADFEVTVTDLSEGARPGLDRPAAQAFVAALGVEPAPKLGWTDVARFSALGVPAVNFGPGDPLFAHKADEHVACAEVEAACRDLLAFLEPTAEVRG